MRVFLTVSRSRGFNKRLVNIFGTVVYMGLPLCGAYVCKEQCRKEVMESPEDSRSEIVPLLPGLNLY